MARNNIFDGHGSRASFALATYERLMSREWVTYADVMSDCWRNDSLPVSYCPGYGELKKAFPAVCHAIELKEGVGCIEIEGNNKAKKFRYIGKDDDPLVDMLNEKTVNDTKKFLQFCQVAAGFFPMSWLEYFFRGSQDLLDIKKKKQKGERILKASLDRQLSNIELLPFLYDAIKKHQVLSIDYQPYGKEISQLLFHPHYLKEFNGRWFLLGHVDGKKPEYGYIIALDRIVGKPCETSERPWLPAPSEYYTNFFKDIVGVTNPRDMTVEDIRIRAYGQIFGLVDTKPIHPSQTIIIPYGKHDNDNDEYGEFAVHLKVNKEFVGRILQMGHGLEIVAPKHVRNFFKSRVKDILDLYDL